MPIIQYSAEGSPGKSSGMKLAASVHVTSEKTMSRVKWRRIGIPRILPICSDMSYSGKKNLN